MRPRRAFIGRVGRDRCMRPLNLQAKFAIAAGVMMLAVSIIITTFLTQQQEAIIREELLARAVALTENLSYNCQLPLAAENQTSLRHLAQGLFKQAEVSYVQFTNSRGQDLLREAEGGSQPLDIARVRNVLEHPSGARSSWVVTADGREFVDVQTAVSVEGDDGGGEADILASRRNADRVDLGRVRVGLTTVPAQKRIAHVRVLAGLLGVLIALAGSFVGAVVIHVLTRPLSQLMEGNRRVARGDFGLRLEVRSGDEFGRLAGSYNQMADEIQRSRELAESYLASLRSNAEHLEEANRALQQSNAELAKSSRMKSEFLAVMSHELRTPLNVILGFSEVLLDQTFGPLNPKQARYSENILASGRHLLSLINDILDMSKVEAGRMKVAPEPFDLRQTAEEIQQQVRNLAVKKGLDVHLGNVPPVTPVTDPKLFRQVLLNLLSNAIKFTPAGGRVDLDIHCLDGRVLREHAATSALAPERKLAIVPRRVLLIEVRDTGIGIATEDQDRIFQSFQQVDATYARRQEGTGLGLALTRKLVTLLGGDIWLQSAPGEGSTFRFWVPFESTDGEADGDRDPQAALRPVDYGPAPWGMAAGHFGAGAARSGAERPAASADWPWGNGDPAEQPALLPGVTGWAFGTPRAIEIPDNAPPAEESLPTVVAIVTAPEAAPVNADVAADTRQPSVVGASSAEARAPRAQRRKRGTKETGT
jgi:signal transduction histidine kinase